MEFTYYKNKESTFNYSKDITEIIEEDEEAYLTWNGDPRNRSARFHFESFESRLNGQDFDTILELPTIFLNIVSKGNSDDKDPNKKNKEQSGKSMNDLLLKELKNFSKAEIGKHIQKNLQDDLSKSSAQISKIEFLFKKIELTMTTLDSVPYIQSTFEGLRFTSQIIENYSTNYSLGIKHMNITRYPDCTNYSQSYYPKDRKTNNEEKNPNQNRGISVISKHRPTQTLEEGGIDMFRVEQKICNIKGLSKEPDQETVWKAVNNLELTIQPLEISITPDLTQFFAEYIFVRESNKIYKSLEKNSKESRLYIEDNEKYFLQKENNIKKVKQEMAIEKDKEKKKNIVEAPHILPTYYSLVKLNDAHLTVSYNKDRFLIVPFSLSRISRACS